MNAIWVLIGLVGVEILINSFHHIKSKKSSAILIQILKLQHKIMAKQEQINATLTQLNEATNALAAKIQKLIDGQTAGDPVSQESLDQLQGIANNLTAMGQDETNPIPPEEPPVEQPPA